VPDDKEVKNKLNKENLLGGGKKAARTNLLNENLTETHCGEPGGKKGSARF